MADDGRKAKRDITKPRSICKSSGDSMVSKFYLEKCFLAQAKSHVGIGYVNDRCQGGGTPVETYFHRPEFEGHFFIEGLIGFHGTHCTESRITASLRKTFRG